MKFALVSGLAAAAAASAGSRYPRAALAAPKKFAVKVAMGDEEYGSAVLADCKKYGYECSHVTYMNVTATWDAVSGASGYSLCYHVYRNDLALNRPLHCTTLPATSSKFAHRIYGNVGFKFDDGTSSWKPSVSMMLDPTFTVRAVRGGTQGPEAKATYTEVATTPGSTGKCPTDTKIRTPAQGGFYKIDIRTPLKSPLPATEKERTVVVTVSWSRLPNSPLPKTRQLLVCTSRVDLKAISMLHGRYSSVTTELCKVVAESEKSTKFDIENRKETVYMEASVLPYDMCLTSQSPYFNFTSTSGRVGPRQVFYRIEYRNMSMAPMASNANTGTLQVNLGADKNNNVVANKISFDLPTSPGLLLATAHYPSDKPTAKPPAHRLYELTPTPSNTFKLPVAGKNTCVTAGQSNVKLSKCDKNRKSQDWFFYQAPYTTEMFGKRLRNTRQLKNVGTGTCMLVDNKTLKVSMGKCGQPATVNPEKEWWSYWSMSTTMG